MTVASIAILVLGAMFAQNPVDAAEGSPLLPNPVVDSPLAPRSGKETGVVAGGRFWGIQAVFQHVNGVTGASFGYSGSSSATAEYEVVSTGHTGHAESVRITFNPAQVSY